jgi:hypothetical protein
MDPVQLDDADRRLLPPGPHRLTLLQQTASARLLRVETPAASFVLKTFTARPALEVQVYALLESLGVPTLKVHARSETALLLEDLSASPTWRLAEEADAARPEVGAAVADWYLRLHQAGFELLSGGLAPACLTPWIDEITRPELEQAAARFDLENAPGWQPLLDNLEALKAAYRSLPQTFNYNDFYWGNLALSRSQPLNAVVFDYDNFRLGAAYSDLRNVLYSLGPAARSAFLERCGPPDPLGKVLDDPLSALYGLLVASRREQFPGWGRPVLEDLRLGTSTAAFLSWLRS